MSATSPLDPHRDARTLALGDPARARATIVMLHGRGALAEDMLALARVIDRPHVSWVAPQARDYTWYPYRFLVPLEQNEPWLSSALALVTRVVEAAASRGAPRERMVLLGFSQGACLALEYAARHARRWGGIVGLSGGLIGPDGTPRDYPGRLDGTPVFLGCSDIDPHIPVQRVRETSAVLARMGAEVTERIYPGMGHTVSDDEVAHVRAMLDAFGRDA